MAFTPDPLLLLLCSPILTESIALQLRWCSILIIVWKNRRTLEWVSSYFLQLKHVEDWLDSLLEIINLNGMCLV